ncbi:hypothetical protein GCM10011428_01740 [Streptomyces violaceus]
MVRTVDMKRSLKKLEVSEQRQRGEAALELGNCAEGYGTSLCFPDFPGVPAWLLTGAALCPARR